MRARHVEAALVAEAAALRRRLAVRAHRRRSGDGGTPGLLAGAGFLSNVVGLGVTGNLIAGGTIPLLNLVVGVEVAGGFAILASEFLDQTAVIRTRRR